MAPSRVKSQNHMEKNLDTLEDKIWELKYYIKKVLAIYNQAQLLCSRIYNKKLLNKNYEMIRIQNISSAFIIHDNIASSF